MSCFSKCRLLQQAYCSRAALLGRPFYSSHLALELCQQFVAVIATEHSSRSVEFNRVSVLLARFVAQVRRQRQTHIFADNLRGKSRVCSELPIQILWLLFLPHHHHNLMAVFLCSLLFRRHDIYSNDIHIRRRRCCGCWGCTFKDSIDSIQFTQSPTPMQQRMASGHELTANMYLYIHMLPVAVTSRSPRGAESALDTRTMTPKAELTLNVSKGAQVSRRRKREKKTNCVMKSADTWWHLQWATTTTTTSWL